MPDKERGSGHTIGRVVQVIGHQVVTLDRANSGAAGIADAVADEPQMMRAATKEAVACLASTVQIEAAEFQVGRIGREPAAIHIEHRGCIRGTGPDEFDWGVAVVSISDPGRRRAAHRRLKRGAQGICSAQEADHRPRPTGCRGAKKCFGKCRAASGILVNARR